LQIVHVVGARDHEWVAARTENRVLDIGSEVPSIKGKKKQVTITRHKLYHLIPYMYNIWDGLAAADLVISRAGATMIAEITARGLPSIVIPFPYAAEDHQVKNAKVLAEAGASIVMDERIFTAASLKDSIRSVLEDGEKLRSMSEASKKLSSPHAGERIVDIIYNDILRIGVSRKPKVKKTDRVVR